MVRTQRVVSLLTSTSARTGLSRGLGIWAYGSRLREAREAWQRTVKNIQAADTPWLDEKMRRVCRKNDGCWISVARVFAPRVAFRTVAPLPNPLESCHAATRANGLENWMPER